MALFRRRKNKWLNDVIIHETATPNDKLDLNVVGDIIYRESSVFPEITDSEFGEDINQGVTENAPYHDTSDYRMIGGRDVDSTVDSQSS